jgi:hypothetical protein
MSALLFRQSYPSQVRRPRLRRAYLLALIPAVVLAGSLAKSEEVVRVSTADGGEWAITISPAQVSTAAPVATAVLPEPNVGPVELSALSQARNFLAVAAQAEQPAPAAPSAEFAVPQDRTENGILIVPQPTGTPQANAYQRIYNSIPLNRTEYLANPSYRYDTTMELLTGNQRQIVVHRNYTPQLNEPREGHPLFLYNRYGGGTGFGYGGFGGGYPFGFNYIPQYAPAFRYFLPIEDAY